MLSIRTNGPYQEDPKQEYEQEFVQEHEQQVDWGYGTYGSSFCQEITGEMPLL